MRLIKIISISKLKFFNKLKSPYVNGLELLNDVKLYSQNINIIFNNKEFTITEVLSKLSDSDYLENILHILSSEFIKNINMELSLENNTPEDDMGYRILIEIVKSLKPPKPEIVEKTALGYTRAQIADELGMGVTTVTDHLAAAKKQIEEIYYE